MPFIKKEIGPAELVLMKKIKKVFDPNGILNPGKIFPV
jgi:FAD/FMN-containing dehydrogenase